MELKARFEQQRGLQMVLAGAVPWRRDDLDALQVGMLEACAVPGLLPLTVQELDGEINLRYKLSGSKMLSHLLRSERWSMADAMASLCKLAETAEQCQDHMLDFRRLLLGDDYIFVGEGWHDLRLTYLPLAGSAAEPEESAGLERLVVRWLLRTEDPDGKAIQGLLELAAARDFAPSAMRDYARRYLCRLAEERAGGMAGQKERLGRRAAAENGDAIKPAPGRGAGRLESEGIRSVSAPAESFAKQAVWPAASGVGIGELGGIDEIGRIGESGRESEFGRGSGLEEAEPSSVSGLPQGMTVGRWRLWLVLLTAAAIGIVWKTIYIGAPDTKRAILSFGVTAACLGICLYLWNGWHKRALRTPGRPSGDEAGVNEDQILHSRPPSPAYSERPSAAGPAPEPGLLPGRFVAYGTAAEMAEAEEDEEDIFPHTGRLAAKQDATELLPPAEREPAKTACYLEWESADKPCRIALEADSLIIGRARGVANHVDESGGVSRAHLELVRQQDVWAAKDLGSRNGSWLNGKPMAPYEAYPLAAGDCVQVAGSTYRFHAAG